MGHLSVEQPGGARLALPTRRRLRVVGKIMLRFGHAPRAGCPTPRWEEHPSVLGTRLVLFWNCPVDPRRPARGCSVIGGGRSLSFFPPSEFTLVVFPGDVPETVVRPSAVQRQCTA